MSIADKLLSLSMAAVTVLDEILTALPIFVSNAKRLLPSSMVRHTSVTVGMLDTK